MRTATVSTVHIGLPDAWFQLPVAPFDRDRLIHRLVRERLGSSAAAAPLRRQVESMFRSQMRDAFAQGAVVSAALVESQPGCTPPALLGSVLVVVTKAAPELTADAIASQWGAADGERVVPMDLPIGQAVKVVRYTTHRPEGWPVAMDALLVQYFVRFGESLIVVQGHTLNVDLEVAFESLFDAIASSLEVT